MTLKLINQKTLDKNIYSDMQKQFPAEELKTYSEYNTLLASGDYKLGLVFDDNNLIGYILYLTKDFIWVDYIAVLKRVSLERLRRKNSGPRCLKNIHTLRAAILRLNLKMKNFRKL